MTECGLAFGSPAIVRWEVRKDTQGPGQSMCLLHPGLVWNETQEGRQRAGKQGGDRDENRLCIEWLPPALAVPSACDPLHTDHPVASSFSASGLCSNVTSSDVVPDHPATAAFVTNVIYLFFTWLLSVSTLWSVSFLEARILACAHPSL